MRKIPMRKCVVTMMQHPKNELTRIVLTPENTIEVDDTGRKNGRGAYIYGSKDVVELAKKTKALDRALRAKVPDTIYEVLLERFSNS